MLPWELPPLKTLVADSRKQLFSNDLQASDTSIYPRFKVIISEGIFLLSEISSTSIRIWTWTSNHFNVKQWNVNSHPCPNFNLVYFNWPMLKLGHGRLIITQTKPCLWLFIHVIISVKTMLAKGAPEGLAVIENNSRYTYSEVPVNLQQTSELKQSNNKDWTILMNWSIPIDGNLDIDGLVQDCSISSALTMEILQSCLNHRYISRASMHKFKITSNLTKCGLKTKAPTDTFLGLHSKSI